MPAKKAHRRREPSVPPVAPAPQTQSFAATASASASPNRASEISRITRGGIMILHSAKNKLGSYRSFRVALHFTFGDRHYLDVYAAPKTPKPDARPQPGVSTVYKVLLLRSVKNCIPQATRRSKAMQSRPHAKCKARQRRHGISAMRCDHLPPVRKISPVNTCRRNPNGSLSHSRTQDGFCRHVPLSISVANIKDPKQNANRTLEQLYDHVAPR